jgi:hypothetical protein
MFFKRNFQGHAEHMKYSRKRVGIREYLFKEAPWWWGVWMIALGAGIILGTR